MAQFVEVEVDLETGHVDVVRVVSAHDVGKALNPTARSRDRSRARLCRRWAMRVMENLVTKDGRILNPYLSTYLIPTDLGYSARSRSR